MCVCFSLRYVLPVNETKNQFLDEEVFYRKNISQEYASDRSRGAVKCLDHSRPPLACTVPEFVGYLVRAC